MMVETMESELRASSAWKALTVGAEAVAQLRAVVTSSNGRTERGVEVPEAKTPLLAAATDQADETYAVLLEWVGYFAAEFGEPSPAGESPTAWRMFQASHRSAGYADAPIAGFKPGTTPEQTRHLIRALTSWLTGHRDRIDSHDAADTFHSEIADTIWHAHGLARMNRRTARDASPRPCPDCDTVAVVAEYHREPLATADRRNEFDLTQADYDPLADTPDDLRNPRSATGRRILAAVEGVTIRCQLCGWVEVPKPALIIRWLEGAEPLKSTRQWQDTEAEFWTISQAALHFGFQRRAIEKYIAAGMPAYSTPEGMLLKPHDVIAEWRARETRRRQSLVKGSRP